MMNRGYLRIKYVSTKMKTKTKTITPGSLPSTIYHIMKLVHMAMTAQRSVMVSIQEKHNDLQVPAMRPMKPKTPDPAVIVIPIEIMINDHCSLCCKKNSRLSPRNATIPTVRVAQATRNPKADSGLPKIPATLRTPLPKRCHALAGGRCSGSFAFWNDAPE